MDKSLINKELIQKAEESGTCPSPHIIIVRVTFREKFAKGVRRTAILLRMLLYSGNCHCVSDLFIYLYLLKLEKSKRCPVGHTFPPKY